MSSVTSDTPGAPVEAPVAATEHTVTGGDTEKPTVTNGTSQDTVAPEVSDEMDNAKPDQSSTSEAPIEPTKTEDGAEAEADVEAPTSPSAPAVEAADATIAAKASKNRRKSGVPEHKGKKLGKKASMAKITHTDAQPGQHYLIKLKGYPLWPGVVCDEDMLPQKLLESRPVTAARADGTYREDFADGGKNVNGRTFPLMYLHTNEFGWIPNTDLIDIDPENILDTVKESKISKTLYAAYEKAAENNNLDHYKELLKDFQEQRQAEAEAKAAAKAEKAASKSKKKTKAVVEDEADDDVDMEDVSAEAEVDADEVEKPKPSKKRKAAADTDAGEETPRASAKKPKTTIKLTSSSTPKANGATPKSTAKKETAAKPKAKAKKAAETSEVPKEEKEAELSPEDKRQKKEKEILFLRHKLQKGLLTRDQSPKEDEMKGMSEFITKLEGYADLEVSIIRATKINKVLKAILKLDEIPKESEYKFKERSSDLLGKWNKILETEPSAATEQANGTGSGGANGTPATSEAPKAEESKVEEQKSTDAEESKSDAPVDPKPAVSEDIAMPDALPSALPKVAHTDAESKVEGASAEDSKQAGGAAVEASA